MSASLIGKTRTAASTGESGIGKRQHPRYQSKRDVIAQVNLDGVTVLGLVSNVTCGGCALVVVRPHAIEDGDMLSITIGGLKSRTATARWHMRSSQRVMELGVEFSPGESLSLEELHQIGCMSELSVLIVESSRVVRRFCVQACETHGYRPSIVSNATEALIALEEGHFDAILTADHLRTGLPGTSLTAALAESSRHRKVPRALLTSDEVLIASGVRPIGVDTVIAKANLQEELMLFLSQVAANNGAPVQSIAC